MLAGPMAQWLNKKQALVVRRRKSKFRHNSKPVQGSSLQAEHIIRQIHYTFSVQIIKHFGFYTLHLLLYLLSPVPKYLHLLGIYSCPSQNIL